MAHAGLLELASVGVVVGADGGVVDLGGGQGQAQGGHLGRAPHHRVAVGAGEAGELGRVGEGALHLGAGGRQVQAQMTAEHLLVHELQEDAAGQHPGHEVAGERAPGLAQHRHLLLDGVDVGLVVADGVELAVDLSLGDAVSVDDGRVRRDREAGGEDQARHEGGSDDDEGGVDLGKIRNQHYVSWQLPVEDHIFLEGLMTRLKELERKVITLFFFQELSQSEIASRTSSPLGTVKMRVKLALAKLSALLREEET